MMMERINDIVMNSGEEEMPPPDAKDHVEHVVALALAGHAELAADHLLHPEMAGSLAQTVGGIIRQLNLQFIWATPCEGDPDEEMVEKVLQRARIYEVMIQVGLNLSGMEPKFAGLSDQECDEAYCAIVQALGTWGEIEGEDQKGKQPIAGAVVGKLIADMKKIMGGAGMMAKMAEEIEGKVLSDSPAASYLEATRRSIRGNVYYRMSVKGLCKLGNDYAMGLRWLRHLGYVQVSTNPVLAAKAYDDEPSLWDDFKEVVLEREEWHADPDEYGDEIAMEATETALWPNLAVFRPIALATNFQHGMVSYQLNPNVAHSLEGSVADALKIYSAATAFLDDYDAHLAWGYPELMERGRPNVVFKVAGGYPASLEITTTLDSLGIGTNNTVTYSVIQETTLIIRAIRGMAMAVKMGIPVTQAYETNMGGRLESHLRDVESERILRAALDKVKDKEALVDKTAKGMGIDDPSLDDAEKKIGAICSYKYLKSLNTPAFVEAVKESGAFGDPSETEKYLADLESDIGYSGTLVCQRVYWTFFSDENRPRWLDYLQRNFELTPEQAADIMGKIDMLPASKRKPMDTYLTLANRNMTNTEFPNHQYNVLGKSREEGFDLEAYENAVLMEHDPGIAERLLKLEDFKRAYELNSDIMPELEEAGLKPDFGKGGMPVEEWSNFGSVVKTMAEFKAAYDEFKERTVKFVKEVASAR
jgi:hypothetical protein